MSDMVQRTKLILGLGNPGRRYENTRHNVGFRVINELLERTASKRLMNLCRSLVCQTQWQGIPVIFAKPMTYMNRSGEALAALINHFDISLSDVCVVYDDLHLDIGTLRMRPKGSDGGHNGIKSIIHSLGTQEFPRLRIGISEPEAGQIDHVLTEFSADEQVEMDSIIPIAADAIETFITADVQTVMNRFNGQVV